jgi:hypothetical protein
MHSVGLGEPIRGLLHADESANDVSHQTVSPSLEYWSLITEQQYTFDLFALASDCSGTLGKRRNELADLYAEAIRTYESWLITGVHWESQKYAWRELEWKEIGLEKKKK